MHGMTKKMPKGIRKDASLLSLLVPYVMHAMMKAPTYTRRSDTLYCRQNGSQTALTMVPS